MLTVRVPQRFELVRELGRGGMGAVYEAVDRDRGARVAIKVLRSSDPVAVARFKREFRALQDIEHPNLVALGELFCEEGQWGFSMDLIEGVDLVTYVRDPLPLPPSEPRVEPVPPSSRYTPGLADREAPRSTRPSFRPPPPIAQGFDEERLRRTFAQLVEGLVSLHSAGKIHRDIKPSNIRVRHDGHVFILDFGLVAELTESAHLTAQKNILGTPAYMAPEHAAGDHVGPEADWYGVGVVLFEALTGRLPFEGNAIQMMVAKQQGKAPRASTLFAGVTSDLDELCARLLRPEPGRRPSPDTILRTLRGRELPTAKRRALTGRSHPTAPFIGRAAELAKLNAAFATTFAGKPSAVLLEGESGTGKSCLAQRFLDTVQQEHSNAVVLLGKCYENEAVPYNAWDSAIESLTNFWRRLEPEDAGTLLPTHVGPLTQTFPALRRVGAVNRAVARINNVLDPREVRRRAFAALRELFERATQRGPTILFIDDLQWIDQDSISLLAEVLREPSPPPLLFLATVRSSSTPPEVDVALRAALPTGTLYCTVPPLEQAEAVELARRLLGGERAGPDVADTIAKEANGHAQFITELARYVSETGHAVDEQLSLTAALTARVAEQSRPAQLLLMVLAVAGRPLPTVVAARAAGVKTSDLPRVVAALRVSHLIRTTRIDGGDWIEAYHERVRIAVLPRARGDAERRVAEKIARALEASPFAGAHLLTEYWKAAGDVERAAKYARDAGDEAAAALAFERAAAFYSAALERPTLAPEERHELFVLLADTLAKAGRGKDAADAYQRAREGAKGLLAFELERKAGEQLLRVGEYEAGIEVTKEGLKRLGIRWPASAFEALLTVIVLRLFLALRGRRFDARDEREVSSRDLARIDVCNNIGTWLLMADTLRGIVFQLYHLRFALAAGEVRRVSLALSYEMARTGVFTGGRSSAGVARLRDQIARASALAATTRQPYEEAVCGVSAGVSLISACLPREGVERLAESEAVLRERCRGKTWEVVTAQLWATRGYFFLGEYASLVATHARGLEETAGRRELFGTLNLRVGYPNFAWLVRDDVGRAAQALDEAARKIAGRGFALEQNYAVFATVNLCLYRGDDKAAVAAVEHAWSALRRSRLRFLAGGRYMTSEYRARAHLAVAVSFPAGAKAEVAKALPWIRDLSRSDSAYAPAMGDLLSAEAAAILGDTSRAVTLLRRAIDGLVRRDAGGYAAVARRALGKLVMGEEGAALVRDANAFFEGQGVKNIPAFCRALAPGFSRLE